MGVLFPTKLKSSIGEAEILSVNRKSFFDNLCDSREAILFFHSLLSRSPPKREKLRFLVYDRFEFLSRLLITFSDVALFPSLLESFLSLWERCRAGTGQGMGSKARI